MTSLDQWLQSTNDIATRPAVSAVAVTAGASNLQYNGVDSPARALYCSGDGDITVETLAGDTATFTVTTGVLPLAVNKVTAIDAAVTVLALR